MLVATLSLLSSPAMADPVFDDLGLVLQAPASGPFRAGVSAPAVEWDPVAERYVMYFVSAVPDEDLPAGTVCGSGSRIGRATSTDALAWSVDEEPVWEPEMSGAYYTTCAGWGPTAAFDGATWHLVINAATQGTSTWLRSARHLTSEDGASFTEIAYLHDEDQHSMVIVGDRLYRLRPSLPGDGLMADTFDVGATEWMNDYTVFVTHAYAGWEPARVESVAALCSDDEQDRFEAFAGGTDGTGDTVLSRLVSTHAGSWTPDPFAPLQEGGLDLAAVETGSVLRVDDGGYLLFYTRTDDATGLSAIGLAATVPSWSRPASHACAGPAPDFEPIDDPREHRDTGARDTGDTDDGETAGGETGTRDCGGDDTGARDEPAGTDEAPAPSEASCGCASAGHGEAAAFGVLALLVGAAVRRGPRARS